MFTEIPQNGIEIRVPASIANLGPGFDTLAVAVRLYLRLKVTPLPGLNELLFEFSGCRIDGENYIERAFRFVARQQGTAFPSLRVVVETDIPMKGGLGSSAAATVAGLRLYEAIAGPLPAQGLLNAACALEGHPDNVAAALLGGLTISCQMPDRSAFAVRLRWPDALGILVLTPLFPLSTLASRGALQDMISREDAVFNVQRVSLLLYALQSGNFPVLRHAFQDRIHQPYRQRLVPGLSEALALEHPDLLGVCLSGAGPSVAAFAERSFDEIERLLRDIFNQTGSDFQIRRLTAHQEYESEFDCGLFGLGI
jgi:homoserine kinase